MPELDGEAVTLVVHDAGPVGGMERQVAALAKGLVERGHPVRVISRTFALCPDGVEHVRVPGPARPHVLAYPWFGVVGTWLVARHRRGVVHSVGALVLNQVDAFAVHLCHAGFHRRAGGLNRASRTRWSYLLNSWLAGWQSLIAERLLFRPYFANRWIAVSEGVASEVRTHYPEVAPRVETIPNGIDVAALAAVARTRRPAPDGPTLLFVGSEWEGKGLRFVLAALRGSPAWRLRVVGNGDMARYSRLARDLGVADRVTFEGVIPDLRGIYGEADAFVLASVYETFSLVCHEAAAAGLPLLATRVGGIEDLIDEGVNGYFIDDDPVRLSTLLNRLAADGPLRARLGFAARRSAERFALDTMVDRHAELYRRLAEERAATRPAK